MPSIIGNIKLFEINNRDISTPSSIYNLLLGTKINTSGFKFLCVGASKFEGLLTTDNINLITNGKYKINNLQIDSNDILYVNDDTKLLKTAIDEKQDEINENNRLDASLISTGIVSNDEYNRLNNISSNILQSNDIGVSIQSLITSSNRVDASLISTGIVSNDEYNRLNNISSNILQSNDIGVSIQSLITDSTNLIMNSAEIETNLILRVKSSNNVDDVNNIVFQNTGTAETIVLGRSFLSGVPSNSANFIIRVGKEATFTNIPIKFVIRNNGNVNIGSSEIKDTFFNVEGNSNFEGDLNLINNKKYKINNLQIDSNNILYDNTIDTKLLKTAIDEKQDEISAGTTSQYFRGDKTFQNISSLAGRNISFVLGSFNLDTTLSDVDIISSQSGNNLDLKTVSNTDIFFIQNNTQIAKINSTGIVMLNSKKYFGDGSALTGIDNTEYLLGNNLSFNTGTTPDTINMNTTLTNTQSVSSASSNDLTLSSGAVNGNATNIVFKTDGVQRSFLNSTKLDVDGDINITTGHTYKINGIDINNSFNGGTNITIDSSKNINLDDDISLTSVNATYKLENNDVLYNFGTNANKNFFLNARVIQNVSSSTSDGLFLNFLNNSNNNSNAHCRVYSGGNAVNSRLFIHANGKVGINQETSLTEKLNVDGNIDITGDYKINGTAIVHSYNNGTNITIDGSKNINLNDSISLTGSITADSYSGVINPYITTSALNTDHPIVMYNVGLIPTPQPPGNLPLIIPLLNTNQITLNSSTGLLKTQSIQITGSITGATNITSSNGMTTATLFSTTVNGSVGNLTTVNTTTGNITTINSTTINSNTAMNTNQMNSTTITNSGNISNSGTITSTGKITGQNDCQITGSITGQGITTNYSTANIRMYAKLLGINTSSPAETLDVNGDIKTGLILITTTKDQAFVLAQSSGHGNGVLSFGMGTGNVANFIYFATKNVFGNNSYGTLNLSTSGSDDRRKHNEIPITNALDAIMKLQCEKYDKTFIFKDAEWSGNLDNEEHSKESGLIAQDVYEIPEFKDYVIVGDEKTSWDINYNSIFTYNIRATQELKLENDELKNKVDYLENELNNVYDVKFENDELKNKVDLLELQMKTIYEKLSISYI